MMRNFKAAAAALQARTDPVSETLETIALKPGKSEILVQKVTLAWAPYWQDSLGGTSPAW